MRIPASRNRRSQPETYSPSRTHRKWGGRLIQYYRRAEDRHPNSSWRQSWGDRFIRKHRFEAINRYNVRSGANLETEEFISQLKEHVRTTVQEGVEASSQTNTKFAVSKAAGS